MANVVDLKAKAYDVLVKIEQLQNILKQINVQITEASQKPPTPEPKTEKPA